MTEREKMYAGLVYDPFSEGMPEQRTIAHRLCLRYNQTTEEDEELRNEILDQLSDAVTYGIVLRAKGIVASTEGEWIHFDFVPGEKNVRLGSADIIGKLCVIGSKLDEKGIAALFGV